MKVNNQYREFNMFTLNGKNFNEVDFELISQDKTFYIKITDLDESNKIKVFNALNTEQFDLFFDKSFIYILLENDIFAFDITKIPLFNDKEIIQVCFIIEEFPYSLKVYECYKGEF